MTLKELTIELETYGSNKGKYSGKIIFVDTVGEIKLVIGQEFSKELIRFLAPQLNGFLKSGCINLQTALTEAISEN